MHQVVLSFCLNPPLTEKMDGVLGTLPRGSKVRCLAPMVRAGSLALRSLALDYGCDLVWSEELIDFKLLETRRVVNEDLKTVDYLVDYREKTVVFFRTHECEKGRVILQLGTGSPDTALQAAKKVEADVAAIDINMGCPKKFSTQGGMGAALLENQDVACEIIRKVKSGVSIPVTAKIRIVNNVEDTVAFIRKLEEAGVSAVTLHLRRKGDTETTDAQTYETLKRVIDMGIKVPIIANGDMYTSGRITEMIAESGCAGVMLARPFLYNPSICREEGPLKQLDIMKAFLTKCLQFDTVYQVIKYTLMEMIIIRRHPPSVLKELGTAQDKTRYATSDPIWLQITRAKSTRDIFAAFDMQAEYAAVYGDGPAPTMKQKNSSKRGADGSQHPNSRKAVRREEETASHPKVFSDSYFLSEEKKESDGTVVVSPASDGTPYEIIVATEEHAPSIKAVTNEAYVVDKFFKLPEYYDRFTLADVQGMMKDPNSVFLVVRHIADGALSGSLYLTVSTSPLDAAAQGQGEGHVEGLFSAVAVSPSYSRQGIGSALIRAAEKFTLDRLREQGGGTKGKPGTATLKMGVISAREDLFKWYAKQGFEMGIELPHTEELQMICLPGTDVRLVEMSKSLA